MIENNHSNQPTQSVVKLRDVSFRWKEEMEPTLLIPSLEIQSKEHLFIKGPSGCGKSTLLGLMTGINTAQEGEVSILDTDLRTLKPSLRDHFRAEHIGYIFQQFNLLPYLSVLDNVTLPCQFSTLRKQRVEGDIKQAAEQVNGQEVEKNLAENKKVDAPESLSEEEQTPFIDDDLRTDK